MTISAKVVFRILAIAAVVLALAGFCAEVLAGLDESDLAWPFARQFMFSQEGNFVNWYQSVTLLGCAALVAIVGLTRKAAGGPHVAHWFVMAVVMAFAAMDEAAQIHDGTINEFIGTLAGGPSEVQSKGNSAQTKGQDDPDDPAGGANWMFVYLPVGLVFAGAYLRFFLALPVRTRLGFVVAAGFYLGGAIVLEKVYEEAAGASSGETALAFALDAASELCEMLGVAVFAGTLIGLLGREKADIGANFTGHGETVAADTGSANSSLR